MPRPTKECMDIPPAFRDLSDQTRDGGYNQIEIGNIGSGRSYSTGLSLADPQPAPPVSGPKYTPLERAAAFSTPQHAP